MRVASLLSVVFAVALSPSAFAVQDSNFYYQGFVNPNTANKMYWKDSVNILQDLDQFSALYIKHHGCVYSIYEYASAEEDGNCGGDSRGETDYWYLGHTPCFKANSAFSLYGILKTSSQGEKDGSYCHKSTYIDTYFTTSGVETIGYAMGLIDYEENGGNNGDDNNGDDNNGDDNNGDDNNGDDNNGYSPSSYCYGVNPNGYGNDDANDPKDDQGRFYYYSNWTSYGTGCKSGNYVYNKFDGAFCKGADVMETLDMFDTFNQGMGDLDCAQIFYGDGEEDVDGNPAIGSSLGILRYSRSCSLQSYPNQCPDPYGLKIKYDKNLERALPTKSSHSVGAWTTEETMKALSWIFLVAGILLLFETFFIRHKVACMSKVSSEDKVLPAREQKDSMRPVFLSTVSSSVFQLSQNVKERIQNYCEEEEPLQIHEALEVYCAPTSEEKVSYVQPATLLDDNVPNVLPTVSSNVSQTVKERIQDSFEEEQLAQICDALEAYGVPRPEEKDSYVQPATVENDNVQLRSPEENAAPLASRASPMLIETSKTSLPALLSTMMKKKRPRLAKLSKKLFGSKQKSSQASI